jgi:helicase-like protein/SNF2 domain-containing protein
VRRWTEPPAIVAEALVGVSDPLLTALLPGPKATPIQVASALGQSLAPLQHPAVPPDWLLPQQIPSFQRILAALNRYHGALLADPVGSGKTYVALAAASVLNDGITACLVPATLVGQWRATAARLGIAITVCSHEQVSRGVLPRSTRGLVIIDESHHFRNPTTRRYRHLAPWLVGRSALLVTATPIVNRMEDLIHQLLLAVRDNALATDGISSIRAMFTRASPCPALGRVVVEAAVDVSLRPQRIPAATPPASPECQDSTRLAGLIDSLRLSRSPPIARLIRGILLRAAGSSPGALAGALRRYRRLLLHASDALRAGRQLDRTELRSFTAELSDQLVWWELFPNAAGEPEIELEDLSAMGDVIASVDAMGKTPDGKLTRLRSILSDGVPTLVFTTWRDTVRYLRAHLAGFQIAWCTGEQAGIGPAPLARSDVLAWFRRPTTLPGAPQHLVVTDVAAEGLDLQRAGRVIHYDLPWTPMRLEQREGRSLRLGSHHSTVEVVRFQLPPLLEARINGEAILARKRRLPAMAGLGGGDRSLWRWRGQLAERFAGCEARSGVARVDHPQEGLLAGFGIYCGDDPVPLSTAVVWLQPDGSWTDAPETIETWLTLAAGEVHDIPVDPSRLQEWVTRLAHPIRQRLTMTRGWRWMTPEPTPAARELLARVQDLVRDASRRHQPRRLTQLERVLAFLSEGHTAGEELLIRSMTDRSESQLITTIDRVLRSGTDLEDVEARLTGLIIFGPAQLAHGELASPPCLSSRPPSSISMER